MRNDFSRRHVAQNFDDASVERYSNVGWNKWQFVNQDTRCNMFDQLQMFWTMPTDLQPVPLFL